MSLRQKQSALCRLSPLGMAPLYRQFPLHVLLLKWRLILLETMTLCYHLNDILFDSAPADAYVSA